MVLLLAHGVVFLGGGALCMYVYTNHLQSHEQPPKQFNDYMKQYLKANPEYSQYDYPSFEEFDRNGSVCLSQPACLFLKRACVDARWFGGLWKGRWM